MCMARSHVGCLHGLSLRSVFLAWFCLLFTCLFLHSLFFAQFLSQRDVHGAFCRASFTPRFASVPVLPFLAQQLSWCISAQPVLRGGSHGLSSHILSDQQLFAQWATHRVLHHLPLHGTCLHSTFRKPALHSPFVHWVLLSPFLTAFRRAAFCRPLSCMAFSHSVLDQACLHGRFCTVFLQGVFHGVSLCNVSNRASVSWHLLARLSWRGDFCRAVLRVIYCSGFCGVLFTACFAAGRSLHGDLQGISCAAFFVHCLFAGHFLAQHGLQGGFVHSAVGGV